MYETIKALELPMRERIVTEVCVINLGDENIIELRQSVPVLWTTSEQTMLLTKEEFAKLFMFVFSEPRPTSIGWWFSSNGGMLHVVNGNLCYLDGNPEPLDFATLKFTGDITWTKIK